MNCFDYKMLGSPVIKAWSSENSIFDLEEGSRTLPSLSGDHDLESPTFGKSTFKNESCDFGLNWLVEEDRNQLFGTESMDHHNGYSTTHEMATENFLSNDFPSDSFDDVEEAPKKKNAIAKPSKAPKSTAQSTKALKVRTTQKKDLNAKITKLNTKNLCAKQEYKLSDDLSTMSASRKSNDCAPIKSKRNPRVVDFSEIKKISNAVKCNVGKMFKFETKGVSCNLPQIFSSSLFTIASADKKDSTEQFINLSGAAGVGSSGTKGQIGQMTNLLASLGNKKEGLNFEAGSYMATLEYTMRSINGIKDLI